MFASCLYEKFACGVWSDPGIVFDEKRGNVNYWEPWYLGWESHRERKPGVPTDDNPRTGPYKSLFEAGHDLHELHALMAPRPLLVSGGSEDPPERWKALHHSVAVNRLLGYENRVAMTNRPAHPPTEESNEQIYLFFEHFLKHADGRPTSPAQHLTRAHAHNDYHHPRPLLDALDHGFCSVEAHAKGCRVRFWATPDNPAVWQELLDAGVDLLNADDLAGLEQFLRSQKPKEP
jgi:hypothetical protein